MVKYLKSLKSLKIDSIGLSETSLEEIFIRLAKQPEMNKNFYKSNWLFSWCTGFKKCLSNIQIFKQTKVEEPPIENLFQYTNKRVNNKVELLIQQFYALIIKRFHRVKRNTRGFLAEIVLPVILVCLALLVASLRPQVANFPAVEIHPWLF